VSASGIAFCSAEVFVAEALSLSRSPDAPDYREKFRLTASDSYDLFTNTILIIEVDGEAMS
jgi:hypothetical protein